MQHYQINDSFKFFVPLEFEKAKDGKGKEKMRIKGIASTADRDSDDEILDPSGFELDYFLKNGFVNWHHQAKNDPAAVIGEPTKANITKSGLYIEADLYEDSALAKKVWDLAKSLEKSSTTRRLGFSIEGKVLERDTLDTKYVKKAKITGVAVTPSPKNSNTLVDIIKGEYSDYEEEDLYSISDNSANGGTITCIVDVLKPNGDRIVVDKDYNIKVISKSLTTESGAALKKEDLEPGITNLEQNQKKIEKSEQVVEEKNKFTPINKFDIFIKALGFTNNNLEKAKQISEIVFKNLKEQQMALTEQEKIDEIKKSLSSIGIDVNEDEIAKAMVEKEKQPEEPEKKEDKDDKLGKEEKAPKAKETPGENDDDDDDDDMEKALVEKQKELDLIKAKIEEKKSKTQTVEVKLDGEELKKSISDELTTKITEFEAKTSEQISKASEGYNTGIQEIKDMFSEFKKGIEAKFEEFEKMPATRKSISNTRVLEKSFDNGEQNQNAGKQVVSLTKNKMQLSNILMTKSGIEKGQPNDFYVNEIQRFEATGQISKAVADDLNINHNILIVQ